MDLTPGTSIGPYSIVREIGRGGMGVVYLARDPRLDRDVAIKALPEHLAQNPERLARFESEARALAQLNHPGVAGILGVEEVESNRFLILEYVEGESLADRLERGALTVDEALEICVKITAGLEAAHEAGVIHRDLKPDNIKITPEGEVKVLDFGLAKMADGSATTTSAPSDPTLSHSPTRTSVREHSPTMPGVILGTAGYMSPEQARGRRLDKRTDIWSFGVVLYECLTGVSPFVGENASDTIGAILHKDADLGLLPVGTPPLVQHVLSRCLERDKAQRYRDIGDVGIELARAPSGAESETLAGPAKPRLALWPTVAVAAAAAVLAGASVWFAKPAATPLPLSMLRAEIPLPDGLRLAHEYSAGLAISPDGQQLAFFAGKENAENLDEVEPQQIMLRRLDQSGVTPLPGGAVSGTSGSLTFSPDGASLAYFSERNLFKVSVSGGLPTKVCSAPRLVAGLAWGDDGSIVVGDTNGGLSRVPAAGGTREAITELDSSKHEIGHKLPHLLPGSRAVLFTIVRFPFGASNSKSVWGLRLDTGEQKLIVERASDARYVNGRIVFMRDGSLYAAAFDADRLELTGDPRFVLEGVQHAVSTNHSDKESGAGLFAISPTGTLAYAAGSVYPEEPSEIVTVDRNGNETRVDVPPRNYLTLRGSPDGRRLLLSGPYAPTSAVWLHEFERGLTRRQRSQGVGLVGIWGPGPDQITYDRTTDEGRVGLFFKPVGGGVEDETEIDVPEEGTIFPVEWSRDGKALVGVDVTNMVSGSGQYRFRLSVYNPGGEWNQISTEGDDVYETHPTLSRDGDWLAYASNESGDAVEVFVRPFPGKGAAVQVSRGGGRSAVWSGDDSELFYRHRDADGAGWIMAAPVSTVGGRLEVGRPVKLFEDVYGNAVPIRAWDVLSDGRFVFERLSSEEEQREWLQKMYPDRIHIAQNWASSLD